MWERYKKLCCVKLSINSQFIFIQVLILFTFGVGFSQDSQSGKLYPGISVQQHELAQKAMYAFFALHWDEAEQACLSMQSLERSNQLLPLSNLLRFGMCTWRILNNEFENSKEKEKLTKELEPLKEECIRVLHKKQFPDSTLSTRLFIEGGIDGFDATLEIRSNPFVALVKGLHAVKLLDSAHVLLPWLNDTYLGIGLFQCALANEPGIVRAAIKILDGYKINLDSGLQYLRMCSRDAYYTNDVANEYLIQFLSPSRPSEMKEKDEIFIQFQTRYPDNPLYVFQKIDEDFAFHRGSLFSNLSTRKKSHLVQFDTTNSVLKCYASLVKIQLAVTDTTQAELLKIEPTPILRSFSFYPLFLLAAKERYTLDSKICSSSKERAINLRKYYNLKEKAYRVLMNSDINAMLKEYYKYHINEGLT